MTSRRNLFVLAIGLVSALAGSSPGFSAAAAGGDGGNTQLSNIPDFSGYWQRTRGKFSPPVSGPGPLTRPQWLEDTPLNISEYTNPILQPRLAEIMKQRQEGEFNGMPGPSAMAACWPLSVPGVLAVNGVVFIAQLPDRVMLLYDNNHYYRTVYLNQPHSENFKPSWFGEFVGYYEGDVLVVDTVGLLAHPMSLLDQFGTPHTEALHVVERYKVVDAGQLMLWETQRLADAVKLYDELKDVRVLQVEIKIEDPGTFTMPWTAIADYTKTEPQFRERVCAESSIDIGVAYPRPTAERPDF